MKKMQNQKWLGFFGFFALFALPGMLEGDWGQAVWLVWVVWFIYFFRNGGEKEKDTRSDSKDEVPEDHSGA